MTQILENEVGYTGSDAIADGYVVINDFGAVGTVVQIDFDGSAGSAAPSNLVFLDGVSNLDANANNDFDPNDDLIL